jgi:hypothetical protein
MSMKKFQWHHREGCEANQSVQKRRICGAMPVLRHALWCREQEQVFVLLRQLAMNLILFRLISMFCKLARRREGGKGGGSCRPSNQNLNRTGSVLWPNLEAPLYNHCRYILRVCVCSLRYPACSSHAPYFYVACLSGCTIFFHIIP